MNEILSEEYKQWLSEIKAKIQSSQIKASIAVNTVLIEFYWYLGHSIAEKQKNSNWGSKLIEQLSVDLKKELPDMKGFSRTNLYYVKQFYQFFAQKEFQKVLIPQLGGQSGKEILLHPDAQSNSLIIPQVVGQLPWGHIKLLISKIKEPDACVFYITKMIEENWGRNTLALQLKSNLYQRQGKAITNFKNTLPTPQSDLAKQTIKDPYVFDFVTLTAPYNERDIENQLVNHVTKFLLELGKGFAFIGRQYHIEVGDSDYYIDLLFYHVKLKCYVVIELKNTKFIPEYAGKLNFYLSAVDELLKDKEDQPTIGIILCRDKNNIEAEFALKDINKPMGVSGYEFTEILPENLKSSLPSIDELEQELKDDQ